MELPRCKRCEKKNIVCAYPNNRSSISNIPELEFPWLDDLMREPGILPWTGDLQPQIATSAIQFPPTDGSTGTNPIPDYLIAEGPAKTTLARIEVC